MSFLQVENLKKRFGTLDVLKDISFSLEKGEVLSLIGSSGGGKTTLLRCLNFLERPDCGTVRIGEDFVFRADAPHTEKQIREMRLHFGLVFQSFNLFPQYTVRKNLTLAAELAAKERARAEKLPKDAVAEELRGIDVRATELLAMVGLSDKEAYYPCQLSGGQQQRAAIARALMLSPDILCFDEPTSALDPELTGEVLRVIRSLKSADRTMVIVTHEMEFARQVSDKVIFIANGLIEEMGTPAEVFDHPKSEKLRSFLHKETI